MSIHNYNVESVNWYSNRIYENNKPDGAAAYKPIDQTEEELEAQEQHQPIGEGFESYGKYSLIGLFLFLRGKAFKKEVDGNIIYVNIKSYENWVARKVVSDELHLSMDQIYKIVKGIKDDNIDEKTENKVKASFNKYKDLAIKAFESLQKPIVYTENTLVTNTDFEEDSSSEELEEDVTRATPVNRPPEPSVAAKKTITYIKDASLKNITDLVLNEIYSRDEGNDAS